GFLISIPGTVTYPKAEAIQQVATMVPDGRLLVETDCPYLTPQSWRGKRNEPAYLVETIRCVAELRGQDPAHVGSESASNAAGLFALTTSASPIEQTAGEAS